MNEASPSSGTFPRGCFTNSFSRWRKPYDYFEYLLNEIPKYMNDTDYSFLEDLLPWSSNLSERIKKQSNLGREYHSLKYKGTNYCAFTYTPYTIYFYCCKKLLMGFIYSSLAEKLSLNCLFDREQLVDLQYSYDYLRRRKIVYFMWLNI